MKYLTVFWKEPVGNPECPMMYRTGVAIGGKTPLGRTGLFSIRLHHFCAGFMDEYPHDHPWPFITFVIKGAYDDLVPLSQFDQWKHRMIDPEGPSRGLRIGDRMRPGKIRYRKARHIHSTHVGPKGCTTIVITGPAIRQWGFWSEGRFFSAAVKMYRSRFGTAACSER